MLGNLRAPIGSTLCAALQFFHQYRVANTRSLETDTNVVGYTVIVGSASYTQSTGTKDAGDGTHDVGLEFPGLAVTDPTTNVTVAYTIVNAGHNATEVEKAIQKGVDNLIADGAKKAESGGSLSTADKAAAAAAAAAATAGASFGTSLIVFGAALTIDLGLSLLFADCEGTCAADKIAVPRSAIDALFPKSGCVVTQTVHYPGTDSADGCGANSSYYVTHTITRAQVGHQNEPAAGPLFIIVGRSSGLVLDIPGGGAQTPGLQIQQWPDNGTEAQHWELEPVDGSYFIIRSSLNGLVLEVAATRQVITLPSSRTFLRGSTTSTGASTFRRRPALDCAPSTAGEQVLPNPFPVQQQGTGCAERISGSGNQDPTLRCEVEQLQQPTLAIPPDPRRSIAWSCRTPVNA